MKGHIVPAAAAAALRPEDSGLGVDLPDGRRMCRCMRCDTWVALRLEGQPAGTVLPAVGTMAVPRRGRELREAIVIRLIAFDRALHSLLFGLLAAALLVLDLRLPLVQARAGEMLAGLRDVISSSGASRGLPFSVRTLTKVLSLRRGAILVLLATAVAYCLVEGIEAVGLWWEKRWAEYLTALATAGFLPFEIDELMKRVTVLRLVALVVNLAILVWLVWAKHLFGVGRNRERGEPELDREELFGPGATGHPFLPMGS